MHMRFQAFGALMPVGTAIEKNINPVTKLNLDLELVCIEV